MRGYHRAAPVLRARADKLTADIRADPDRKELHPCRSIRKSSKR